MKGCKKIFHAHRNQNKSIAIFISNKLDVKPKTKDYNKGER